MKTIVKNGVNIKAEAQAGFDREIRYYRYRSFGRRVKTVRDMATAKFDETIELATSSISSRNTRSATSS
jgi:hypothetical protein